MKTPAISVQHLVKEYRRTNRTPFRAVDDLSFEIRSGQIYGLLGPNGAGKSTTIRILSTLIPPTSGRAMVNGIDVTADPLGVRRQLCVVLQENAVDTYLSVRNNFITYGKFHGMSAREVEMRSGRIIELFELREVMDQQAMDLSGGMKRRVQVAKIFFSGRPIVFLDEATTGMDTFNKRATIQGIKEEAAKGRTIVLTTHMLEEAEELCDAITIVDHGTIVASGSTSEIKAMGLKIFDLTLTFSGIPEGLADALQRLRPVKMAVDRDMITMTVRDHATALKALAAAQETGALVHFEISTASLEDVFVELIGSGKGGRP